MNLARILLDYMRFHPNWFDWEEEKEYKPSKEALNLVRKEWGRNSQRRYKIKCTKGMCQFKDRKENRNYALCDFGYSWKL